MVRAQTTRDAPETSAYKSWRHTRLHSNSTNKTSRTTQHVVMIVIKRRRRRDVQTPPTSRRLDQQRSLLPLVTVTKRETCPSQSLLQETQSASPPSKKATRQSHLTSPLLLLLFLLPSKLIRRLPLLGKRGTHVKHALTLHAPQVCGGGKETPGRKQSLLRCRQRFHP